MAKFLIIRRGKIKTRIESQKHNWIFVSKRIILVCWDGSRCTQDSGSHESPLTKTKVAAEGYVFLAAIFQEKSMTDTVVADIVRDLNQNLGTYLNETGGVENVDKRGYTL